MILLYFGSFWISVMQEGAGGMRGGTFLLITLRWRGVPLKVVMKVLLVEEIGITESFHSLDTWVWNLAAAKILYTMWANSIPRSPLSFPKRYSISPDLRHMYILHLRWAEACPIRGLHVLMYVIGSNANGAPDDRMSNVLCITLTKPPERLYLVPVP